MTPALIIAIGLSLLIYGLITLLNSINSRLHIFGPVAWKFPSILKRVTIVIITIAGLYLGVCLATGSDGEE